MHYAYTCPIASGISIRRREINSTSERLKILPKDSKSTTQKTKGSQIKPVIGKLSFPNLRDKLSKNLRRNLNEQVYFEAAFEYKL